MDNNKFYVYEHWLYGECIYVGKGRINRPLQFCKRNDNWKAIVGDNKKDIIVKIIEEFDTNKEALKFEQELTEYYKSINQCKGNGKMSGCALIGSNNPFYGKHHSEESRHKMSKTRKNKSIGSDNSFYGKHHSEESKQKMRKAKEIKVKCIETNKEFNSLIDAAKYAGVVRTQGISKACKTGELYRNYHWEFL